jgi:hypothetical protein
MHYNILGRFDTVRERRMVNIGPYVRPLYGRVFVGYPNPWSSQSVFRHHPHSPNQLLLKFFPILHAPPFPPAPRRPFPGQTPVGSPDFVVFYLPMVEFPASS